MKTKTLSIQEVAEHYGYTEPEEFLVEACGDSVVPSLCELGCEVEPDGHCEHGHPSVLLVMGLI